MKKSLGSVPVLDGLRASSILLVMTAHLAPLGPKTWLLNETAGAMGMSIFFSLSGFLIASYLLAGQAVDVFFVRRAARILPLAYAYLLIATLIDRPAPNVALQNVFFLENYTYAWIENNHFWSLCVEIHFYLFIGLSVAVLGKRGVILIPIACAVVTIARFWTTTGVDIRTHLRVDEICIGTCVAIAYQRGAFTNRTISPLAFILAVVATFISSWPGVSWIQYARPYCAGTLLAAALMLSDSTIKTVMVSRPAKYIARISYALYIIHLPLALGAMSSGPLWAKYLLKRPITILATFGLAHFSTFYYEAWFIAAAKRYRPESNDSVRVMPPSPTT